MCCINSHGQLKPSKSIGGTSVYGLAGRLTSEGGLTGPILSVSMGSFSAFASADSKLTAPRNDERIDEFKLSRSRALLLVAAEECNGELPFRR